MLTHDYHSNNDDGLNSATLRTFSSSKNRSLLDNEHVRQDGPSKGEGHLNMIGSR